MTTLPPPHLTADAVINSLGLAPHPEGGFYRETFRDPAVDAAGRAASTAIYFLLQAGQVSRWHKVDATEVWHWYAGAPLQLSVAPDAETRPTTCRLGPDIAAGERPQHIVPPHHWQQAASAGEWTLVGCTVAPGFLFSGFQMAPAGFAPGK